MLHRMILSSGAVALTILSLAAPVAAQAIPFGCYERVYTAEHLARNSAQQVRRIVVDFSQFDGETDTPMAGSAGIGAYFRGQPKQHWAGGSCRRDGGAIRCNMDGDAGYALLKPDAGGLRLEIPEAVAFEIEKPDGDLDHRILRNAADRVFLLRPAPKKACAAKG